MSIVNRIFTYDMEIRHTYYHQVGFLNTIYREGSIDDFRIYNWVLACGDLRALPDFVD